MKLKNAINWLWILGIPLVATGCSQGPNEESAGTVELNLQPATLEEAELSLKQIDALQKVDAKRALSALVTLRLRLDELNHLVARVEPEPGHFVSFYESQPGLIGIAEVGPAMGQRLLTSAIVNEHSATRLFQRLANGAPPPAALIKAQEREVAARLTEVPKDNDSLVGHDVASSVPNELAIVKDGVASVGQALTAADGQWWRDNVCYNAGDSRGCFPNWGNGGYATASTKTSFFQVAPFSGNAISVRFQYSGSTQFTTAVFPGEWAGWWWHSDSFWDCCGICACGTRDYNRRTHRWDILNATGDEFHWTYAFKWSCGSTLSCDQSP